VISSSHRPLPYNTQHSQRTDIHAAGEIRTHNLSWRAAAEPRFRPRGQWDRLPVLYTTNWQRSRVNICHELYSVTNVTISNVWPSWKLPLNAVIPGTAKQLSFWWFRTAGMWNCVVGLRVLREGMKKVPIFTSKVSMWGQDRSVEGQELRTRRPCVTFQKLGTHVYTAVITSKISTINCSRNTGRSHVCGITGYRTHCHLSAANVIPLHDRTVEWKLYRSKWRDYA
jgi:hypothetical protein